MNWYLTQLVQKWVDGSTPNLGVFLATPAGATTLTAAYAYAGGVNVPSLNIDWSPRVGAPAGSPMQSIPMGDGIGLDVNAANGNGELSFPGFDITGTGLNLNLGIHQSTQEQATSGVLGQYAGARLGFFPGPAMQLSMGAYGGGYGPATSAPYVLTPSGAVGAFIPLPNGAYWAQGINALLVYAYYGSTPYWVMQMNDTGELYFFGTTAPTAGLLLYDETRDGEYISYNWSSDAHGNAYLASITDTQGRTITPTYGGPAGAVSEWTDSTGRTLSFGYNSSAQVTTITNPAGGQIQLAYAANGAIDQITDPNGQVTTLNYDSANPARITSVIRATSPSNPSQGPTYSFNYQSPNQTTCANAPSLVVSETVYTDPDGHITSFCDNAQDQAVVSQDAAGNTETESYDAMGGLQNAALNQGTSSAETANTTFEAYQGIATQEPKAGTLSAGGVTATGGSASYANNTPNEFLPDSSTDPQGNVTHYAYDGYGNLTSVQDPLSSQNTINLTYEAAHPGWLASSSTPDGVTTSYGYDGVGNLTSITPPSPMGSRSFSYDNLSRLASSTDGNNNTTSYSYDKLDDLTSETFTGGITDTRTYDPDGNLLTEAESGTLAQNTYNSLGELTQQVLPTGQTVSYSYDPAGNMLTFSDGAGTYTYTYNALNELTTLTEPNGNKTTFTYDSAGDRTQTTYPDGVTLNNTWVAGQLTDTALTDPGGTGDIKYSYIQNPSGQTGDLLQSVATIINGATYSSTSYGYDALGRLLTATTTGANASSYSYTYDGDGNRLSEVVNGTTNTYSYTPNTDQLASVNGQAQSYDANGNLTASDGTTLGYNSQNQLTGVAGSPAFSYFGIGQNDETTVNGTQLQNTALGLTAITANGSTNYITPDDSGTPIGESTPNGDYYFLTNPLTGSVLYTFDANGNTARINVYAPYGAQTTSGSGPNDIGWDGAYTQTGLDLYHFGARQYQPSTGRWTQVDPNAMRLVNSPTQADAFAFANDDPINSIDPSGDISLKGALCVLGICGALGSGLSNVIANIPVIGPEAAVILEQVGEALDKNKELRDKLREEFHDIEKHAEEEAAAKAKQRGSEQHEPGFLASLADALAGDVSSLVGDVNEVCPEVVTCFP